MWQNIFGPIFVPGFGPELVITVGLFHSPEFQIVRLWKSQNWNSPIRQIHQIFFHFDFFPIILNKKQISTLKTMSNNNTATTNSQENTMHYYASSMNAKKHGQVSYKPTETTGSSSKTPFVKIMASFKNVSAILSALTRLTGIPGELFEVD